MEDEELRYYRTVFFYIQCGSLPHPIRRGVLFPGETLRIRALLIPGLDNSFLHSSHPRGSRYLNEGKLMTLGGHHRTPLPSYNTVSTGMLGIIWTKCSGTCLDI